MKNIIIVTDSNGLPRQFPLSDLTYYKDTFPVLIREKLKTHNIYQLSFGGIETEQLFSNIIGYFGHTKPELIIIQCGFVDSTPRAFSRNEVKVLNFINKLFKIRKLKLLEGNKNLIRKRQKYRVLEEDFIKIIRRLKIIFNESKIIWIGIVSSQKREKEVPGSMNRV